MEPVFSLSPWTITSDWPRPLLVLLIKVQVHRFLCVCIYTWVHQERFLPYSALCSSNPIKALLLWGLVVLPSTSLQLTLNPLLHTAIHTWNCRRPRLKCIHTPPMYIHTHTIFKSGMCGLWADLSSPWLLAAIILAPWGLAGHHRAPYVLLRQPIC